MPLKGAEKQIKYGLLTLGEANVFLRQRHREEDSMKGRQSTYHFPLSGMSSMPGKAPPSNGELDASHSSNKLNQNNLEAMKSNTTEVPEAPLSKMPRFMKPTVSSSRRKSVVDYQTFEERVQFPARRRRPLSHRAESVSFPIKRTSDYNSECSISRNSCLVGLNVKSTADDETEYSHDATECDVKNVIFPEQETSSKSSVQQKDCLVDSES